MFQYPAAITDWMAAGKPFICSTLFHATVRHPANPEEQEGIGFWNGHEDRTFVVGGAARGYIAGGSYLTHDPMRSAKGLRVQTHTIKFSSLNPLVHEFLFVYRTRLGIAQIHEVFSDPFTHNPIAPPVLKRTGRMISLDRVVSDSGDSAITVTMASSAWELTKHLPLRKSVEVLQRYSPGDTFRDGLRIAGAVPVFWASEFASTEEAGSTVNWMSANGKRGTSTSK